MATRATSSPKKKKPAVTQTTAKKKPAAKKSIKKQPKKTAVASNKVDYYPNRMTVAISVLAGTVLVLVTLIAVLGIQ